MNVKVGRPRTGTRAAKYRPGEKVSQFTKLTGRYPAAVAARVRALADARGEPLWSVLCDAAERYLADVPPAERRRMDTAARRTVRALERDAAEHYERNLAQKATTRH